MGRVVRLVRAILSVLEDKEQDANVPDLLEQIRDNHLFHMQAQVTSLQTELHNLTKSVGKLEGRLGLVLAMGAMVFSAVIGLILQQQF